MKPSIGWNPKPRLEVGAVPSFSECAVINDGSTASVTERGARPAPRRPGRGARLTDRLQLVRADRVEHARDARGRGDAAGEIGLVAQRAEIRHAVAAMLAA